MLGCVLPLTPVRASSCQAVLLSLMRDAQSPDMGFGSPALVLYNNKAGKKDHYKMIISKWPGLPSGFDCVVLEVPAHQ